MLPNFFIIGASKSGTTSLYHYLRQHPDVFMPEWKEPCYFFGDDFGKFNHRVKNFKEYNYLFEKGHGVKAIGEASSGYLMDPTAADNIKKACPGAKIIVLLRNPVEMAFSLYKHCRRKEGETIPTFKEALDAEEQRASDYNFRRTCYGNHNTYLYSRRAMYGQQIQSWFDRFPREDILVLIFEEFFNNLSDNVAQVFRFLEVDPSFRPKFAVHNKDGEIVDIPPMWRDIPSFVKTFRFIASGKIIRKIPYLLRNILHSPKNFLLEDKTRQDLMGKFESDISKLEVLLGKDLSLWRY